MGKERPAGRPDRSARRVQLQGQQARRRPSPAGPGRRLPVGRRRLSDQLCAGRPRRAARRGRRRPMDRRHGCGRGVFRPDALPWRPRGATYLLVPNALLQLRRDHRHGGAAHPGQPLYPRHGRRPLPPDVPPRRGRASAAVVRGHLSVLRRGRGSSRRHPAWQVAVCVLGRNPQPHPHGTGPVRIGANGRHCIFVKGRVHGQPLRQRHRRIDRHNQRRRSQIHAKRPGRGVDRGRRLLHQPGHRRLVRDPGREPGSGVPAAQGPGQKRRHGYPLGARLVPWPTRPEQKSA